MIASSLLVLAALQTAASGDLTATYATPGAGKDYTMTVELAANGDMRAQMGFPGFYMVRHAGHSYLVMSDAKGPMVEDLVDVFAVVEEEMAKAGPHMCEAFTNGAAASKLVARGTVTVAGRTGTAYAMANARPGQPPALVIGSDPALAPLGAAIATEFRLVSGAFGHCPTMQASVAPLQSLLESGAPLQLGPAQLEKVEFAPIDPARFVLPATPASRETIRATFSRQSPVRVTIEPNK